MTYGSPDLRRASPWAAMEKFAARVTSSKFAVGDVILIDSSSCITASVTATDSTGMECDSKVESSTRLTIGDCSAGTERRADIAEFAFRGGPIARRHIDFWNCTDFGPKRQRRLSL